MSRGLGDVYKRQLQYFADDIRLKGKEADCIYAGIIIDTNNFILIYLNKKTLYCDMSPFTGQPVRGGHIKA